MLRWTTTPIQIQWLMYEFNHRRKSSFASNKIYQTKLLELNLLEVVWYVYSIVILEIFKR
jgi:hypothetical protein